jgi:hypothetical protein
MALDAAAVVRVRTRLARAWVRAVSALAPVIGAARARRWAVAGALRLVRVEVVE